VLVWTGAIASQVAIIGWGFAWSYFLAQDSIGSSPANGAALITVWVSDPSWHVAPRLEVRQQAWILTLSTEGKTFGATDPNAEAVVALWGDAELTGAQPTCYFAIDGMTCNRPISSIAPGSYQLVQVPKDQADFYVGGLGLTVPGFPGPTVPAQVFSVTARDLSDTSLNSPSAFPVIGQPSPSLETTTSTGWSAFLPSVADNDCSAPAGLPPALPAAIAAAVPGSGEQNWYETSCPASIQLLTGTGERFSDSAVPPSSMANGVPTWTASDNSAPDVGGFLIDVADPAIAATAQKNLFGAGVLAGIAGGLLAGWLAAGVTFIVKRYTGERS
jgi:hypothetical protein